MLLKYRSDYQKIAMGLLSLMPTFKDWDRLQHELAWYQAGDDRTLYLWKDTYDDFAGAVGTQIQGNYLIVRLITLMPDKDVIENTWQLLDQLARAVPDGVHLHEVVAKGDTVSISGSAESSQDIAQLMRRLEASEGAHSTRLQHVRADGARGTNEFQLMVRQGESSEAQP